MAKCSSCNSCLRIMIAFGERYYVCAFEKIVFDRNFVIITDKRITDEIGRQRGWKIE